MCSPQSGHREHVHEAPAVCRKPWPNSLQVHLVKVTVINFPALNRTDRHPEPDCTVRCQENIPGLHDCHVNSLKVCGSSVIKVIVLQIRKQSLSSPVLSFPSLHPSIIIYADIYASDASFSTLALLRCFGHRGSSVWLVDAVVLAKYWPRYPWRPISPSAGS